MPYRWRIDECCATRLAGWIDDDGPVDAIDVAVNGRHIATLSPVEYRKDLQDAGIGDGRRSFSLSMSRYLVEPLNLVSISCGSRILHTATVRRADAESRANAVLPASKTGVPQGDRETSGEPLLKGDVRRVYRDVTSMEACEFYHVVDLPDGPPTRGQWDLRKTADRYLGNVDFAGRRVIEIGPASGFLSFHMERRGARVAVIEPPMESFWDLVPQSAANLDHVRSSFGSHIEQIRNSFWYLHKLYRSSVECYEIDAYRIPPQPIKFDIGVLGSVLLHVSSPVRMLESVAAVVADRIILTERYFPELTDQPVCRLLPTAANGSLETWWEFSPKFFEQYLGVLGLPHATVTRHRQFFATLGEECEMFTIVAARS